MNNLSVSLNEWKKAQEFFVSFAQALAPKTPSPSLGEGVEGEGLPFISSSSSIAERILSKSFESRRNEQFSHVVRLLPTLQVAQKEMARWIEILPEESEKSVAKKPALSKEENFFKEEKPSFIPPFLKKEPTALKLQKSGEEMVTVKAKKLVEEVRAAIQTLSSSAYLSDPQVAPLRSVLTKLKPLVDEMIDSLKNGIEAQKEKPESCLKRGTLSSKSERLVNESRISPTFLTRSSCLPSKKESVSLERSTERREGMDEIPFEVQPKSPSIPNEKGKAFLFSTLLPTKKEEVEFRITNRQLPPENGVQKKGELRGIEIPLTQQPSAPKEKTGNRAEFSLNNGNAAEEKRPFLERPFFPTVLPVAQVPPHSLLSGAAKKKKQKRYFFKQKEEEDL